MFDPISVSTAHQRALLVEKQTCRTTGGVSGASSSSSPIKCFGCGEIGHRQFEYKKAKNRVLFTDIDDSYEEDVVITSQPIFDGEEVVDEEAVEEILGLY
ncbi:conserved hypothetical protein [Ricinus communis]|uniref:CCHC-type domain-containing protein n=1 Tax=Ricinus communis TaxID=3988 RepID=B9SJU2_RICCO|nr:conserved hypothetical protein [Ricinus communis]